VRGSEDFRALAVLFKRVKNIARELGEPPLSFAELRVRLTEPAEMALLDGVERRRPEMASAVAAGDYARAFVTAAAFRADVDRFFTDVFVMVDDASLRTARLSLMVQLRDLIMQLADISEIVGDREG
jgi:glycyl-tRNA synthetase beta chain